MAGEQDQAYPLPVAADGDQARGVDAEDLLQAREDAAQGRVFRVLHQGSADRTWTGHVRGAPGAERPPEQALAMLGDGEAGGPATSEGPLEGSAQPGLYDRGGHDELACIAAGQVHGRESELEIAAEAPGQQLHYFLERAAPVEHLCEREEQRQLVSAAVSVVLLAVGPRRGCETEDELCHLAVGTRYGMNCGVSARTVIQPGAGAGGGQAALRAVGEGAAVVLDAGLASIPEDFMAAQAGEGLVAL